MVALCRYRVDSAHHKHDRVARTEHDFLWGEGHEVHSVADEELVQVEGHEVVVGRQPEELGVYPQNEA